MIAGVCDRLGTAIFTDAGISSVSSWIAAAETQHTMARGARCATAIMSGYDAGGASARRKTPRESSMICPPSRQAYRSRGFTPRAREVSVVNVAGSDSSNSFMDTIHAQVTQLCMDFIHEGARRSARWAQTSELVACWPNVG